MLHPRHQPSFCGQSAREALSFELDMLSRREWIVAGGCLLLFGAAAVLLSGPNLLHRLHSAAQDALNQLEAQAGGERFNRLSVVFEGQTARLHGTVRSNADAQLLVETMRNDLRTPGNPWNPVTRVAAEGSLRVRPLDPGWLLAAVRGFEVEIIGVCASNAEREALEEGLRRRWPTWRGKIEFGLQVDNRRFDEAADWIKTVRVLPAPEARGSQSAKLLAAAVGGAWQELPLEAAGAMPGPLQALGLSESEWRERVQPLQTRVREHLLAEAAWEAEQERLRRLPPAHVILGQRGDQVLLRGEVFDLESKRALFSAIMTALPGCRILDDLRASGERRPGPPLGVPETALIQTGEMKKTFLLGLPGGNWTPLDPKAGNDAASWRHDLPSGVEVAEIAEDHALVLDWLNGSHAGIPALPAPPRPAFITLAAYAGRVVVGGQLAEEALRAQLVEAVKRAYPAGWSVRDEVEVTGACATSATIQHTLQSVPVAAPDGSILAVALPGQPWRRLPESLLQGNSQLAPESLPGGLNTSLVTAALQPCLEEMRSLGLDSPPTDDKP